MHLSCLFICLAKTDLSEQSIGRERIFFSSLYLCIYVSISLARSLARALSLCLSLTRAFSLLFALSLSLSLSPPRSGWGRRKGWPGSVHLCWCMKTKRSYVGDPLCGCLKHQIPGRRKGEGEGGRQREYTGIDTPLRGGPWRRPLVDVTLESSLWTLACRGSASS